MVTIKHIAQWLVNNLNTQYTFVAATTGITTTSAVLFIAQGFLLGRCSTDLDTLECLPVARAQAQDNRELNKFHLQTIVGL